MKNNQEPPARDAIGRLAQEFNKLPGIGPKSAQRITFYLLRSSAEQARGLVEGGCDLLSLAPDVAGTNLRVARSAPRRKHMEAVQPQEETQKPVFKGYDYSNFYYSAGE